MRTGLICAAGLLALAACAGAAPPETPDPALQGAGVAASAAPQPAPPRVFGAPYRLRNAALVVVAEPQPTPRYTQKSLAIVPAGTLLDVARQATVRVAHADAAENAATLRAIAPPVTDIAASIEPVLLTRLVEAFDLPTRATRVEDRARSFALTATGGAELAAAISQAGLLGYVLDVRVDEIEIATSGRTVSDATETFSLIATVGVRLIDLDTRNIIRAGICRAEEEIAVRRPSEPEPIAGGAQDETAPADAVDPNGPNASDPAIPASPATDTSASSPTSPSADAVPAAPSARVPAPETASTRAATAEVPMETAEPQSGPVRRTSAFANVVRAATGQAPPDQPEPVRAAGVKPKDVRSIPTGPPTAESAARRVVERCTEDLWRVLDPG